MPMQAEMLQNSRHRACFRNAPTDALTVAHLLLEIQYIKLLNIVGMVKVVVAKS